MLRQILGIITGYAIFVVSSLALFKISGVDPHSDASIAFMVLTVIYGVTFSFISGLITQLIAKIKTLKLNYILALIIAGFAAFSLIKSEGSHWTQLFAIIIFAPVSILGGLIYTKR